MSEKSSLLRYASPPLTDQASETGGYNATASQNQDPWAQIAAAYGLGAPPAQGLPSTLPGVNVGAPPQMGTGMGDFNNFTNQINGQIQGAYNYDTPQAQAALMDRGDVPQGTAQQYGTSDELKRLLGGEGYSAKNLAQMKATATEQPAQAGLQQMSQMKRLLGQSGIQGGAAAALQNEVSRQTGQNQGQALRDVDLKNSEAGLENTRFGVGQQTQIGMGNMQQANSMALANANMMFQALSQNQQAQNSTNQMNTQLQAQQRSAGANASGNFLSQQGAQGQQQRHDNEMQNNQNAWQGQQQQTQYDWEKQKLPWQELNNRYGQATNTLGSWAQE